MKKISILSAVLCSAVIACGPSGSDDVIGLDTSVDVQADIVADIHGVDTMVEDTGRDIAGADVQVDVTFDVALDIEQDTSAPCPGNAGCECVTNTDCYSNFCVETAGKKVCSKACDDEDSCPRGWTCSQVTMSGDTVYICIDPFARACRPCVNDDECEPPVGAGTGVYDCIPYGPDGSFCGNGCTTDADCSEGYHCDTNPDGPGLRCLSATEACECTAEYIAKGYLTQCFVVNEIGKCFGTRTCDGECDAVPAVAETCNQYDDNCDGRTDEGIAGTACTIDNDYGSCPGTASCVNGVFNCAGKTPANETCNGADDDCDGSTDEEATNCVTYYLDADDDGFGLSTDSRCLCQAYEDYSAIAKGDCNDGDINVYPGVIERCNGKDDNCDGHTDEVGAVNCVDYYLDVDDDTWGNSADKQCLCAPSGDYTATRGGDCNDGDAGISGGGAESCNGVDDDCDSQTDEEGASGCAEWYRDVDNDTFGDRNDHKCLCASNALYKVDIGGDCNDANGDVNPAQLEGCNDIDDDCDAQTDEEGAGGCTSHYYDNDGDQYGVGTPKCLCDGSGKYTALVAGDCADSDGSANPGMTEVCNSKDDDCDGNTDEPGATGCTDYFLDTDRDTWGVSTQYACLCAVNGDFRATRGGDCNDADEEINPSRTEQCNGVDDECDGSTDEDGATGCVDYYLDSDRDGYGDVSKRRCMCLPLLGTYDCVNATDCCDIDANAFPGQTAYFDSPTQCGLSGKAYDFNCSGANEVESTASGECDGFVYGCDPEPQGWRNDPPDCGQAADWLYDCSTAVFSCNEKYRTEVQGCR